MKGYSFVMVADFRRFFFVRDLDFVELLGHHGLFICFIA